MNKKKMEQRLYRYYDNKRLLVRKDKELDILYHQLSEVAAEIKNNDVTIDDNPNMGMTFEERVQTSSNGTSITENQLVSAVNKLVYEEKWIKGKILKIKAEKRNIERINEPTRLLIEELCEQGKLFVEYRYDKKMTQEEIGIKMYEGQQTMASRMNDKFLKILGV